MSVIVDFSIFPVDKEESVSPYVSDAVKIIEKSGLSYQLGPMGTSMEGEWEEIMGIIKKCYDDLKEKSDRIYMTMKVDYRKGSAGRLADKVKSVEEKI